jgi:hypothetical protein
VPRGRPRQENRSKENPTLKKRQANLIIAGILAVIVTQIACDGLILRGQERTRNTHKWVPTTGKTVTTRRKVKHAKATHAKPRKLVRPPHAPLIYDPAPIERQIKR